MLVQEQFRRWAKLLNVTSAATPELSARPEIRRCVQLHGRRQENREEPADDVYVVGHDIMAGGVVVAVRAPKC